MDFKSTIRIMLLFQLVWVCQTVGYGDMLLLQNETDPVFGLVEQGGEFARANAKTTFVFYAYDRRTDRFQKQTVSTSQVRMMVRTIDQSKLQNLDCKDIPAVRDYAEELVNYRKDPVAQKFARRLLLLCLYHGAQNSSPDTKTIQSAAKVLVASATDALEKRKLDQLAVVYGVGQSAETKHQAGKTTDRDESYDKLLLAVAQALRQDRFGDAAKQLDSTTGKQVVDAWREGGETEFYAMLVKAIQEQQLSTDLRHRLLTEELRIRFGKQPIESTFQMNGHSVLPETVSLLDFADFDLKASREKRSWLKLNGVVPFQNAGD